MNAKQLPRLRIGQGFDVHPFADDRKLFLGGIEIPARRGLAGHSDADVLLHAICDAILGALGWGDIGHWFPDSEEEFRGIDSALLLERIWKEVVAQGWSLGNLDCTVLAEQPKIAPFVEAMRERLAALLEAEKSQIAVKATTCEKLGFVGREEGIAALSVVLLVQ